MHRTPIGNWFFCVHAPRLGLPYHGARADAIGALICAATILVVMIVICRQWVKALQVYLNYDQYEDTYLERPSTKPQGIAHVISSATSFTKKGETIY